MNFKVGDIVRGILGNRYACTGKDMTKGEVVFVDQDKRISVQIIEHNHPEKLCCDIGHIHVGLVPASFELVTDKPILAAHLNVEVNKPFKIIGWTREIFIDSNGIARNVHGSISDEAIFDAIQHPEKIIRQPQFSEDEKALMRLLVSIGTPFIARDKDYNEIKSSSIPQIHRYNPNIWIVERTAKVRDIPKEIFSQITWENSPFDAKGYLEGLK